MKEILFGLVILALITIIPANVVANGNLPVADANGPYYGCVGEVINLDGSGSFDPDDNIILYEWDVDEDGTYDFSSSTSNATTIYVSAGIRTVSLRVTDEAGNTDEATTTVNIVECCNVNTDCDPLHYCAKDLGDCDGTGECMFKPTACPPTLDPICGCDGITYSNECDAAASGVNVAYEGECREPEPVPTLTPIGLIVLAGSLGLIAAVMMRRR